MSVVGKERSKKGKRRAQSRGAPRRTASKNRLAVRIERRHQKRMGAARQSAKQKHRLKQVEAERSVSFEDGYRRGKYDGGEFVLAQLTSEDMVLPDIPVEHVIALGYEQVKNLLQRLLHPDDVFSEIHAALQSKQPLSLVRLGDGELLALSHDKVLSSNLVRREGPFLGYSGIQIPDHKYRDQLAESIRHATIVGVPMSRTPNYHGLLLPAFRAHGLYLSQMRLTSSTVNYMLSLHGYLQRLLQDKQILIVGNVATELAEVLRQRGLTVSGVIQPVRGVQDIPRVIKEAGQHHYDVALVAAGIPAVILAERIATQYGKVALDIGHLANKIVSGEASL